MSDKQFTGDLLTALHDFISTMNKDEFTMLGSGQLWDKATEHTYWPDIFTILSYADIETRTNIINWLIKRMYSLKMRGHI